MIRALAIALLCSSCTQRDLQYTPTATEIAQLQAATDDFLRGGQIDREGQHALVIFGIGMLYQRSPEIRRQMDLLFVPLMFAIVGARVGEVDLPAQMLSEMVSHIETSVRHEIETRFGPLAERELTEWPQSQCHYSGHLVSYKLGLLRHASAAQLGPGIWSNRFDRWRKRVRRLHAVTLDCGDGVALVVLDSYGEKVPPRVALWHAFSQADWQRIEPQIRQKLELSPSR